MTKEQETRFRKVASYYLSEAETEEMLSLLQLDLESLTPKQDARELELWAKFPTTIPEHLRKLYDTTQAN